MTKTINIHGLFDIDGFSPNPSNGAYRMVRDADRIVAVDVTTQAECVLFGTDAELVFDSFELRIEIDADMPDERLGAIQIVRTVKGHCDLEHIEVGKLT